MAKLPNHWDISPARPEERVAALERLFEHLPADERDRRVINTLALLGSGDLDPRGVLVARRGGAVAAVFVCLPLVGATGLVWTPSGPADAVEALVAEGLSWLRDKGCKLAQL